MAKIIQLILEGLVLDIILNNPNMKKFTLTTLCIFVTYIGFAQDSKKREQDFTKSLSSGSFVTYQDVKPVKEGRYVNELTSITEDGGTSTFLTMKEEDKVSQYRMGINLDTMNKNVFVYPNPANSNFTIRTNVPSSATDLTFELYDKAGKMVKRITDVSPQGEISISKEELILGVYIYNILSGTKIIWSGRLIID
jgi:hypothetical protein